jgi:hypothetical protein
MSEYSRLKEFINPNLIPGYNVSVPFSATIPADGEHEIYNKQAVCKKKKTKYGEQIISCDVKRGKRNVDDQFNTLSRSKPVYDEEEDEMIDIEELFDDQELDEVLDVEDAESVSEILIALAKKLKEKAKQQEQDYEEIEDEDGENESLRVTDVTISPDSEFTPNNFSIKRSPYLSDLVSYNFSSKPGVFVEDEEDEEDPQQKEDQRDPNFQGWIRSVKGATLVYKRKELDGTFTEMWIIDTSLYYPHVQKIIKKILGGAGIQPGRTVSEDGQVRAEIRKFGNAKVIKITGMLS